MSIQPFEFPETGQAVRTITVKSEPWFVAGDVCGVLEIANVSQAVSYLDDDEKEQVSPNLISSEVGGRDPWIVSEPGLYSLILRSRKPQAKAFKRWITHDVLPTIRRTGQYAVAPREMTKLEALRAAIESEEARIVAEARAVEAEQQVRALEPAARSWDVLASAKGDFSLRDAAHILNRDPAISTGQNRLMVKLGELGMTDRRGTPYSKHSQHLVERPRTFTDRESGEERQAKPQIRVTGLGLHYLHKRMGGVAPLRFDALPLDDAS